MGDPAGDAGGGAVSPDALRGQGLALVDLLRAMDRTGAVFSDWPAQAAALAHAADCQVASGNGKSDPAFDNTSQHFSPAVEPGAFPGRIPGGKSGPDARAGGQRGRGPGGL